MSHRLNGKVALVTGASRGLGKHISKTLADAGATVIVNYANNYKNAQDTVDFIASDGGRAIAIQGDVRDEESVEKLIKQAEEKTQGSIDILVNNATGPQPVLSIEELTWQDYLAQLEFFVKAPLLLTKAVLPGMKEKKNGRIINIGSEVVQLGIPNHSNYVMAKAAQLGLTRSWANELGSFSITVNMINPGFIPVERHEAEDTSEYRSGVPLGRMGVPQDIGNAVLFLASDAGNFITGQSLSVNGGNTLGI
ncbi:3-oxoacyl-ACP reductase [Oceanobacillus oncorhynchi subsp. incaldanensis]|uniref:SDR family oxidoreductase n=1 Tax=Oceanobacillus TaxID=182709 RepID=UPI001B07763A|nr:SDR family oxidoreductase [Oceanobacillus oncorhynchi]UUI39222.1 SDR family oxidoreductase [Oceanobacillus oncorhynchi]GIO17955.1 3-oxoacyl-ACP reductase [Oceanobacillus oncorhynchi subsp. incaldanensis]